LIKQERQNIKWNKKQLEYREKIVAIPCTLILARLEQDRDLKILDKDRLKDELHQLTFYREHSDST